MAIRWLEGFDHYGTSTAGREAYQKVYGTISNGTPNTLYNRTGGQALSMSYSHYIYIDFLNMCNSWEPTEVWLGFACYHTTVDFGFGIVYFPYMNISATPTCHGNFYFHTDGTWEIKSTSNSLVEQSTDIYNTGVWTYYEAYFKMGDAGTGHAILKMDGKEIINDNTGDYKNGSYTTIRGVKIGVDSAWVDDLYIDDSQFRGPVKVHTFFADADGTHSDFTRNTGSNDYEAVDDSVPDDDTTYVEGTATGDKSTFGITTSGLSGRVVGASVFNRARKTPGDYASIKTLVRVGGSDYLFGQEHVLSENYLGFYGIFAVNPDTSNMWTATSLDNAEFGLQITALTTTTTTV